MPILYSRGVIVTNESPNNITEIRTTSDAPIAYNSSDKTYYKFDSTLAVGSRWVAQAGFFTLPTLTAGSVLFSDGTTIAQNNTNFNWDNSVNKLSVFGLGLFNADASGEPAIKARNYSDGGNIIECHNNGYIPIIVQSSNGMGDGTMSLNDKSGTEQLRLSSTNNSFFTNNLGLGGNTTPSVALDITGLTKMTYLGATAGARVLKVDHSGTGGGTASYVTATGITGNNNKALYLRAANSTTSNTGLQINVDPNGFNNLAIECIGGAPSVFDTIGIGTYTPNTSLDVAGEVTIQNRSSVPTIVGGYTAGGIACDLSLSTELVIASGQLKLGQQSATNGQALLWNTSLTKWLPATIPLGSVTSIAMTVPTGLSISGSPITGSGTFAVTYTAGYSLPTTASQTNWDTAYTDRNKWDGGATGLTASTGRTSLGATTVGSNLFTLANPTSITFPRINADNTVSALDAATFRTAIGAGTGNGTVTSVAALTLGTTGTDLSSSVATGTTTPVITLNVPTASATNRGVLSSSDWSTFNSKGSGTVTSVAVTLNNGITGSVATPTTSAVITLGLGTITPTTVNGLTITTTTGTLTLGSAKTLTVNNSLAFIGTDSTTITFPTTSATIARTDAAQTFTGVQTMTSPALTTPTITGTPTGTGVATAATASTLVLRDSNVNVKSNNHIDNFTTVATAAGTTTLTVSSSKIQEFTGSTTQTITLPVVSTLTTGHKYEIINNSSGNLTINSSGSNLVGTIGPGSAAHLTCDLITGTSAASWTFSNIINPVFGIPIMFGDGVNVLSVGAKNGMYIPFGYTILEWTLGSVNGTSGSIQLDLWVDSYANFPPTVADTITASAKPLFSSTTKGQSSTLTGWTTTIAPDRWLYVNIDSVTSINQLSGTLKCRKL